MNRVKCKQEAEKELQELGFHFGYLTEAYQRPNLFNSEESVFNDKEFKTFKLYSSKAGKRFIVAKDGNMYYLTN